MTPERWRQIVDVLEAVREQAPEERAAFLDEACADDQPLRTEVESFLVPYERAESFLEVPAFDLPETLTDSETDLLVGQSIGPYRLLSKLGKGAMGAVYLAEDTGLWRKVAIKLLPEQYTKNKDRVRRFQQEARTVAALEHPNIISIHVIGQTERVHFIVTELVEGKTLRGKIAEKQLSLKDTLNVLIQVASALQAAHAAGIVHRDIKPENIMVRDDDRVKVLDFGIAKLVEPRFVDSSAPTAVQTGTGIVPGTPNYMSPEQLAGAPVDPRSDLFSLGALLYECLTGEFVFQGNTVSAIWDQIRHVNPPPPSRLNPDVPPELDRITLKLLAKKPEERYQSTGELLTDLRQVSDELQATGSKRTRSESGNRHSRRGRISRRLSGLLHDPHISIPVGVALTIALIIAVYTLPYPPHRPALLAAKLYDEGRMAMRDGAYYKASKMLEEAVRIDDKYALAHAAFAETLTELDYSKKAMREMLIAQDLVRKEASPLQFVHRSIDQLYIDAIDATIRRDFQAAIDAYAELARRFPSEPYVYVDLGHGYEKNEELDKAIDNYSKAASIDPASAAAFLRLGILYGRRGHAEDVSRATEAFNTAETLYDRQANDEGVAEVRYQRGAWYNTTNRLDAAQEHFEQVLRAPRANEYQKIRALLQLSSVFCIRGDTNAAQKYANDAIARAEGMENLTASGLLDLGNAFFVRGPRFYGNAEEYFTKALNYAAGNGQRTEMRARLTLANLRIQQGKPDEALGHINSALDFYVTGRYRKESLQAWNLIGRAYSQKGDYDAAMRAYYQALQIPEQVDPSQVAYAHSDLGNLLVSKERFPEALSQFQESYRINETLNAPLLVAYDLFALANVSWQLGRYGDADESLNKVSALAAKTDESFNELRVWIPLTRGHADLSQMQFAQAKQLSAQSLAAAGTYYKDAAIEATWVLGLSEAFSGAKSEGMGLCRRAVGMAQREVNPQLLSAALLAQAEALLEGGDAKGALTTALQAADRFKGTGQQNSEWRAWAVAASASLVLGDVSKAREYAATAAELQSKIQEQWGAEMYEGYLARKDVQHYSEQVKRALQ